MRTPEPGQVDPGPIVTGVPAATRSREPDRSRGASWISRPMPWPVGWERVPEPGLVDRLAAGPVDLAGRHPGGSTPAWPPGPADQLVQVALALGGPADHQRAGHVGTVAVDPGPEVGA